MARATLLIDDRAMVDANELRGRRNSCNGAARWQTVNASERRGTALLRKATSHQVSPLCLGVWAAEDRRRRKS